MRDLSEFASFPFEVREEFIRHGSEPLAEEPTLVEVNVSGLTPVALKWFGHEDSGSKTNDQFFFSIFPPNIPEWNLTSLSEWCVVGVGKWEEIKDKFPGATPIPCESEDWIVAIVVNHSLTDLSNRDMFGRPYFARLATRLIGSQNVRHIVPQELLGETIFRPIAMC